MSPWLVALASPSLLVAGASIVALGGAGPPRIALASLAASAAAALAGLAAWPVIATGAVAPALDTEGAAARATLAVAAAIGLLVHVAPERTGAPRADSASTPARVEPAAVAALLVATAAAQLGTCALDLVTALLASAVATIAAALAVSASHGPASEPRVPGPRASTRAFAAATRIATRGALGALVAAWGASVLVAISGAIEFRAVARYVAAVSSTAGEIPWVPFAAVVALALGLLAPAASVARDARAADDPTRAMIVLAPLVAGVAPLARLSAYLIAREPRVLSAGAAASLADAASGPWTLCFAALALALATRHGLAALARAPRDPVAAAAHLTASAVLLALAPTLSVSGAVSLAALAAAVIPAAALLTVLPARGVDVSGPRPSVAPTAVVVLAALALAGLAPGPVFALRVERALGLFARGGAVGEGRLTIALAAALVTALQLLAAVRCILPLTLPPSAAAAPHEPSSRVTPRDARVVLALVVLSAVLPAAWHGGSGAEKRDPPRPGAP